MGKEVLPPFLNGDQAILHKLLYLEFFVPFSNAHSMKPVEHKKLLEEILRVFGAKMGYSIFGLFLGF